MSVARPSGNAPIIRGTDSFTPMERLDLHRLRIGSPGSDDEDFPVYLTTGRVVSQYLSGTQTRRIGALVDQYPEPRFEIHPRLAKNTASPNDWVTVTTRRREIILQAMVVKTIRPDTVFIPYHWPGQKRAPIS